MSLLRQATLRRWRRRRRRNDLGGGLEVDEPLFVVEQPGQAAINVAVRLGQTLLKHRNAGQAVEDFGDRAQCDALRPVAFVGATMSGSAPAGRLPRSFSSSAKIRSALRLVASSISLISAMAPAVCLVAAS